MLVQSCSNLYLNNCTLLVFVINCIKQGYADSGNSCLCICIYSSYFENSFIRSHQTLEFLVDCNIWCQAFAHRIYEYILKACEILHIGYKT